MKGLRPYLLVRTMLDIKQKLNRVKDAKIGMRIILMVLKYFQILNFKIIIVEIPIYIGLFGAIPWNQTRDGKHVMPLMKGTSGALNKA